MMICTYCNSTSEYETNEVFLEITLPPYNSSMKEIIENELNNTSFVEASCTESCKRMVRKTKRLEITNCEDVKFLIVILSRGVQTNEGYRFLKQKVDVLEDVFIR